MRYVLSILTLISLLPYSALAADRKPSQAEVAGEATFGTSGKELYFQVSGAAAQAMFDALDAKEDDHAGVRSKAGSSISCGGKTGMITCFVGLTNKGASVPPAQ